MIKISFKDGKLKLEKQPKSTKTTDDSNDQTEKLLHRLIEMIQNGDITAKYTLEREFSEYSPKIKGYRLNIKTISIKITYVWAGPFNHEHTLVIDDTLIPLTGKTKGLTNRLCHTIEDLDFQQKVLHHKKEAETYEKEQRDIVTKTLQSI